MTDRLELLVVDDIADIADMVAAVARRLPGVDVKVTTESDGRRALTTARDLAFDVVVTDLDLRTTNGFEVLREARQRNPAGRRVMITAYEIITMPPAVLEAASVDVYLHKPFRPVDLLRVLSDLAAPDAAALTGYRAEARAVEHAGFGDAS